MAGFTLLCSILLVSTYCASASKFFDAMKPESEYRDLKSLEKRRLLNELEVEEDEEDLNRRLQEDEYIYNQMEEIVANARKRQLRQTPAPVIRLRMTPPPNEPEGIVRLRETPPPEAQSNLRITPAPDNQDQPAPFNPYNINLENLPQTPRVLRLTPAPYIRDVNLEDFELKRMLARREMDEMERMRRLEMMEEELYS